MKTEQLLKVYQVVKQAALKQQQPKPVRNHYNAATFG